MSSPTTRLSDLESDPSDDAAWLSFAENLDSLGSPLASILREALGGGGWSRCRHELFRRLDRRMRSGSACDCVERALPLFEDVDPDDLRPRVLIETQRRYASGVRLAKARSDVADVCKTLASEVSADPRRHLAALRAVQAAYQVAENPSLACLGAAYAMAIGRFGPEVHFTGPNSPDFKPEWRNAVDLELRWQVARLLKYHLEIPT